jgi:DNA-directed RNA polymerase specialized sigma24 family protein
MLVRLVMGPTVGRAPAQVCSSWGWNLVTAHRGERGGRRGKSVETNRHERVPEQSTNWLGRESRTSERPEPGGSSLEGTFEAAAPIAIEALKKLPEDRRTLIVLAYLRGESRLVLSRRFGVPIGTIKTWLHRTLPSLREDCAAATPIAI